MILYDFSKGKAGPLPVPPEISLLNHRIVGRMSQYLFLNSIVGKMAGFILCNRSTSFLLHALRLSKLINKQVDTTYSACGYRSLNAAFTHRYDNPIYPCGISDAEKEKFITSPVSAYLSIRDIEAGSVTFFPGVKISISRMLGAEDRRFSSGKLFVFTLKPHHDHTIDFPTGSAILSGPLEISKTKFRVDSTDLNYIRSNARQSVMDENHRVASILHSQRFDETYAMVEVGANIVNSIEQDYDEKSTVQERGSQKAHFNFGSTVILAIPDTFMAKVRVIRDIYDRASQFDGACEITRGTAIMYDRSVDNGTYSVSDGVRLHLASDGHGNNEVIER
ncbi:MAG: phosphatidylserine decarboxylase [Desulfobacterales bacterium]